MLKFDHSTTQEIIQSSLTKKKKKLYSPLEDHVTCLPFY